MRVAIYARYSTDNQREASIDDQIRECERLAGSRGWTVVDRYADHAISGKVRLRPQFQALIRAASEGRFDVVVAEALDRLSRNLQDTAGLFSQFQFYNVRIETLAEGDINMLAVGFKGTMNALYAADSADKTRRGMRGRVEKGRSGGGRSYGYRVVADGERGIHEGEAQIVRRIFSAFAEEGLSPKAIAKALNAEGIPGPRGSWGPSTIHGHASRGTGILNNELYVGRMLWNRLRYVMHPLTRRRIPRLNAERERLAVDVPHLRIVSDELWSAVKKRQAEIRKRIVASPSIQVARRPRYLFSGLTRCGVCGHGYTMYSAHHLTCAGARDRGVCDNRLTIRRERVEERVLHAMYLRFWDAEPITLYCQAYEARFRARRSGEGAEREQARRDLAGVKQRLGNLVAAVANGLISGAVMTQITVEEQEKARLEALLRRPAAPMTRMPSRDEMTNRYRAQVWMLREALAQAEGHDAARERLRRFVAEIRMVPESGTLSIMVKPNAENLLAAGGLNLSSNVGCGGGI